MSEFIRGANLPWLHYGHDFGRAWTHVGVTSSRPQLREALASLAEAGAQVVRWFTLADGRAFGALRGRSQETGDLARAEDDLAAALELAGEVGVQLMPVLLDYLICDEAKYAGAALRGRSSSTGAQMFGRAQMLREPGELLDEIVAPFVASARGDARIFAWDLMNEPEWALTDSRCLVAEPLSEGEMRAFLQRLLSVVREAGGRPITLGCASFDDVERWRLPLDVFQFHHYGAGPLPARSMLPVAGPVVVGEFSSRRPELLSAAREAGYDGALMWSLLSDDDESSGEELLRTLSADRAVS